jgi:hypothetical protein
LANSSIAKIIPPSGVLKAAAKPEAAPAIITFFSEIGTHHFGNLL